MRTYPRFRFSSMDLCISRHVILDELLNLTKTRDRRKTETERCVLFDRTRFGRLTQLRQSGLPVSFDAVVCDLLDLRE